MEENWEGLLRLDTKVGLPLEFKYILYKKSEGVATITINRP